MASTALSGSTSSARPGPGDADVATPLAKFTPATTLLAQLGAELRTYAPFAQMAAADVERFVAASRQTYYAPGEVVAAPAEDAAPRLLFIRRGAVAVQSGGPGPGGLAEGSTHYEAGDLFPAAAVAAARPVSAAHEATTDLFCLEVEAEFARTLALQSAVWADFLAQRVQHLLALARSAWQAEQGARALAEHSMESPLANWPRRTPVACAPGTPLVDALQLMHQQRVGSVLVLDDAGTALGILTRHDVLERVALARPPQATPIEAVMSAPVRSLPVRATAQQAALAMSQFGIRHLPLTDAQGRVTSVVSERDLYALQRLSLKHVSGMIRAAGGRDAPEALVACGAAIRQLAGHLLTQGLAAHSITEMLSHLNDLLTAQVVTLAAKAHGLDLARAAWLAFGSEGRSEQTIATDQDNGLVLADEVGAEEREAWRRMASEVNQTLDACGYPLCKGGIMAGNPDCCLTQQQWLARFEHWMAQGAPEDLLRASIYFDLRPLAGNAALAQPLRERITEGAQTLPRFCKQLADNALRSRPALNWRGALDTTEGSTAGGRAAWLDLKLGGTAIFVEAARLMALARGVAATGTRERLLQAARLREQRAEQGGGWLDGQDRGQSGGQSAPPSGGEAESQASAFEFLQMLRLRAQVPVSGGHAPRVAAAGDEARAATPPNRIDVNRLSHLDRRLLKEALHVARALQQRIALDYPG